MKNKGVGMLLSTGFLLILWALGSMGLQKAFLPSPISAFKAFYALCVQGEMLPQFGISAMRVVVSMLLGIVLAAPFGMLTGRIEGLYRLVMPMIAVLYPLPKVVFLPILVVLFGLGNLPKIVLITFIIFFQIFVVVVDASHQLPQAHVDAMKTLSDNPLMVFRHLLWPACLPAMLTSLRITVGTAIAVLFFAETFASFDGLGYLILNGMESRSYDDMYAGIIGMALLGILLYEIIYKLERCYCDWAISKERP